jgi:arabinofuranosyltransferase
MPKNIFSHRTLSGLLIFPLILAYLFYGLAYIQNTSFVIDGERYYALFDDAMISMKYAQNLANGDGLVWNPGEAPVEGYSNPLWVVYMALLHLLPLPVSKIGLAVQLSGLLFLAINLFVVKKIGDELSDSPWVGLLAAFITAFYLPLNNWGLQGMEVSLLALMVSTAIWWAIRCVKNSSFSPWLYLFLGLATFVRIDMAVPYLAIMLYLFWFDQQNRKKHFLWGAVILAAFLGAQTLFRLVYYGDLLPNTYYLKMTGVPLWFRIGHGIYVYWQFLWTTNWILYLIPLAFIIGTRDRYGLLLALVFLSVSAYSVYVGGDAWEHRGGANRFIAVGMPAFFVTFSYTLEQARKAIFDKQPFWLCSIGWILQFAVVVISVVNFGTMIDENYINRLLLNRQPLFVRGTERYTQMGLMIQEFTSEDARVAVVTAGAIPYYANRNAIDLMGKSDSVIAQSPMRVKLTRQGMKDFRPGHSKWDYTYSILELKPDVVAQLWDETTPEAEPMMEGDYRKVTFGDIPMYLRLDSPYIAWDIVEKLAERSTLSENGD